MHISDFCGESFINLTRLATPYNLHTIPDSPYNYPNNLKCQWYITAEFDSFIVFRFKFFHVELYFDYVTFGYGHNVSKDSTALYLSGRASPNTLTINDSLAWVTFETNPTEEWWGFDIELEQHTEYGKVFSPSTFL